MTNQSRRLILGAVAALILLGNVDVAHAYADFSVSDSHWTKIWADEFDTGTAPSAANWFVNDAAEGFGVATYTAVNSTIASDAGVSFYRMQANNIPALDGNTDQPYSYTGAAANSHWADVPFSFLYGQVIARMRLPAPSSGQGSWPALWMVRADQGTGSFDEIDSLENLGDPANHYTMHWGTSNSQIGSGPVTPLIDPRNRWCQYIMQWYSDHVSWYLDEEDGRGPVLQFQTDIASQSGVPSHAMYLRLDEELGGWSGDPSGITNWPLNFDVDWIRVYQYAYPNAAPSAPGNPSTTIGDASLTVWSTPSPGATSYSVYRSTTSGGEGSGALVNGLTNPTYTDTGLSNGTRYYYKITAANGSGTSAPSTETSGVPGLPSIPAAVSATPGNSKVTLTWQASARASTYNVYRGTTASGESGNAYASGITATNYVDTAASNSVKYFYTVGSENVIGYSPWSREVHATASPLPPAAPTGLTATAGQAP